MLQIENRQHVKEIVMYPNVYAQCEIGGDWYENRLEISFTPDMAYPDYTEVQNWIMENVDGQMLNIEDVSIKVYKFLEETYKPKKLRIINNVTECRTHFNVKIITEREVEVYE